MFTTTDGSYSALSTVLWWISHPSSWYTQIREALIISKNMLTAILTHTTRLLQFKRLEGFLKEWTTYHPMLKIPCSLQSMSELRFVRRDSQRGRLLI